MALKFSKKPKDEVFVGEKASKRKGCFSFHRKKNTESEDFDDTFEPNQTVEIEDDFIPVQEKIPAKKKRKFREKRLINNKFVIGILSLVLSLIIGFVFVPLSQYIASTETTTIIRAKTNINKGEKIDSSMLQTVTVPVVGIQETTFNNTDDIIGQYAVMNIVTDENIMQAKLSNMQPTLELSQLQEGHFAVSVSSNGFASSVSGQLLPGDIVSIYANENKSSDDDSLTSYRPPELCYVKVISCSNEDSGNINSTANSEDDKNLQIPTTVTLDLINNEQAQLLAGLEANAQIHFALVSRNNESYGNSLLEIQKQHFVQQSEPIQSAEEKEQ
ncbi:MAG: RcpC/CpaB family pilus assembly protein [Oscillospiraceae bacterium]